MKTHSSTVRDLILSDISSYITLSPGDRLGVAVSGGADSVALLHVLFELRHELSVELEVLHLNHGWRGEESDADERFVMELARSLGLLCHHRRALLTAGPANLEEQGRQARLEFFSEVRALRQLRAVATGHTLDDQAETVLFRLLRGTGLSGLAGIQPFTTEGMLRPLLRVRRDQLRQWLVDRNLSWREDRSNEDPRFARNRIRGELLPVLSREWNPQLSTALSRLATQAREEEEAWGKVCETILDTGMVGHPLGFVLQLARLESFPPALVRRVLRSALKRLPGCSGGDAGSLDRLAHLAGHRNRRGSLHGPGFFAQRSFDALLLAVEKPAKSDSAVNIPEGGGIFRLPGRSSGLFEMIDAKDVCPAPDRVDPNLYNVGSEILDGTLLTFPLTLRGWRFGDSYQPVGYRAQEKLKRLFQKLRIPSWERTSWPILTSEGRIVWARKFGVAEWAAARKPAGRRLRVREIVSD